jgi:outer membrane protein TolC
MQFPLFFWQRQKGPISEARALKTAAAEELREKERAVRLEVEKAIQNLSNAFRQVRFFEEHVLKEAKEVYRKTLFSYQEGEIGYLEVIDSRRTWVDVRNTYSE